MGRKKPAKVQSGQVKYADPREAYLSTKKEMLIIEDTGIKLSNIFSGINTAETAVIAEDQRGFYVTGKSYVGALTMDPYRSCANARNDVSVTKTDLGFDIMCNSTGTLFSVTV